MVVVEERELVRLLCFALRDVVGIGREVSICSGLNTVTGGSGMRTRS